MSEQLVKNWKNNKLATESTKEWNNLPHGPSYCNSSFEISIAHCKAPILERMGQQEAGGQSYWKTNANFNYMILKYLVYNWDEHYPKIIKMMEDQEKESLKACQSYIDELQQLIDEAK